MTLFKKIPAPVKTVAEAIAPFREVQNNLQNVMKETDRVQTEAAKRIEDAKIYATEVEKTEGVRMGSASAEQESALKILKALSSILGEEE